MKSKEGMLFLRAGVAPSHRIPHNSTTLLSGNVIISKRGEIELRGNGRVGTAPRMVRSGSGDVDAGKLGAEDGCIYAQAGKGLGSAMSGV